MVTDSSMDSSSAAKANEESEDKRCNICFKVRTEKDDVCSKERTQDEPKDGRHYYCTCEISTTDKLPNVDGSSMYDDNLEKYKPTSRKEITKDFVAEGNKPVKTATPSTNLPKEKDKLPNVNGSSMYDNLEKWWHSCSHSSIFSVSLVIFSAFVVIVCVVFHLWRNDHTREHNYNEVRVFKSKLKTMEKDFPNQNEIIWNMLRNGGERHLKGVHSRDSEEKLAPMNYLVAGYTGSNKIVDCFLSKLTDAYTKDNSDKDYILNSQNFSGENDKDRFNDAIMLRLNGTQKLIVVKDIDKLRFNVAQLFMSYADEHNTISTYPQSVIFLTTELPFSHDPALGRHLDEGNVGKHFQTVVWEGVHPDKAAPLWSRIGDGLILIKKEEIYPCHK